MFTRQDVCALTGIPVERVKSLIRRDELPFSRSLVGLQGKSQERAWNRFSAFEVFLIAIQECLFRQNGYADGVSAKTASDIVTNNKQAIYDALCSPSSDYKNDQWIGYAGSAWDDATNENPGGRNVFGALEEVMKMLRREQDNAYARLLIVNADATLREVHARAKKNLKIDFIASALTELNEVAAS
jgi:hypothetical protein